MPFERASGILCHPTSFPSRFGIGDLGKGAYDFIDWLASARQQLWQVLPLGPTGYGDSPYQCFSAFAGNPLLISPEGLAYSGLLPHHALYDVPYFPADRVDFGSVITFKQSLLRKSYAHFKANATDEQRAGFAWFQEQSAHWLPDFSLFMALKGYYGGGSWHDWPRDIRLRQPAAMERLSGELADEIEYQAFLQWVFWEQWEALKVHCGEKGIQIIGDVPIFVAEDSADVWANPDQFKLDEEGNPIVIAGVPPDLFSATGQRWGNPHYVWEEHQRTGYAWWIRRIEAMLQVVDIVRIDHFRGFDLYYKIPADRPTAQGGRWVNGPKIGFFRALSAGLGRELDQLPIIAEDLGDDLGAAIMLRDTLRLPGMAILQFALSSYEGDENRFLPHNHVPNMVIYTGTHDNNTVWGWWTNESSPGEREHLRRYVGKDGIDEPHCELIRLGMESRSHTLIIPLQDVLGGGSSTRMNKPGVPSGQWRWRCTPEEMDGAPWERLKTLTEAHGRMPGQREA